MSSETNLINKEENEYLLRISNHINEAYVKSKHDFEQPIEEYQESLDLNSHLHYYEEAMIIYFGCRIHGLSLMEFMKNIHIYPDSMKEIKEPNYEEYEKISDKLKRNLDYFNPGLGEGGKKWLEKNWDNPDI